MSRDVTRRFIISARRHKRYIHELGSVVVSIDPLAWVALLFLVLVLAVTFLLVGWVAVQANKKPKIG